MEFIEQEQEFIYDPLQQYKLVYQSAHRENAEQYFAGLKDKSGIDAEANRLTVRKLKEENARLGLVNKEIGKLNAQTGLLVFLIIAGLGAVVFAIVSFVNETSGIGPILSVILGPLIAVLSLVVLLSVIRPKKAIQTQIKGVLEKEISRLTDEGYAQMEPLNRLFDEGMPNEIFRKTIPQIHLDNLFEYKRLDYLAEKFKFRPQDSINASTLFVQSGVIFGNPFFVGKELLHRLGTKTYSGSIVIHWTTTSYQNGKMVTQHHSQTLTATVEKPCPYYRERGYAVYGNEAAPELMFHRLDSDAEVMNEKQITKHVDKEYKKLTKASQKAIAKGENYTVMANEEFEVLWGAKDRNHEVQFRLLFTPLAQKQLLDLMKDKAIGFGDDFDFVKDKMINYVFPSHLDSFPLDIDEGYFRGYDYEEIRKKFVGYNEQYLRNIYFALTPFLAIPLYQHQKPQEYIYRTEYESNLSFYEHEKVGNMMDAALLRHPESATRNIIKTKLIAKEAGGDRIEATAYGYKTVKRTDYITRMGGDGRSHTIPVEWIEYIPVNKKTQLEVKAVEGDEKKSVKESVEEEIAKLRQNGQVSPNLVKIGRLIAYTIK